MAQLTAPTVCKHHADAVLAQAAAVQNTWYTILDTAANIRIYQITALIVTAGETIAIKITIDGNVLTATQAQDADAVYYWGLDADASDALQAVKATQTAPTISGYLEGKSVKVEMRKTTAAGANTLTGRVKYGVVEGGK